MRVVLTIIAVLYSCSVTAGHAPENSPTTRNNVLQLEYSGFTVWLDCDRRAAVRFEYSAGRDTGSLPREDDFDLDPDVPDECQQGTDRSYRLDALDELGWTYDRGHLVPANHLDHLPEGIWQSNFMTNILPQASAMNRGAWLATEEITECWRDETPLRVQGGVIWIWNPHDEFFENSHGIETPDYFWKVITRSDAVIAWIIPNSPVAKRGMLDAYLVSPAEIEAATGVSLGLPDSLTSSQPAGSWPLPAGCDKG